MISDMELMMQAALERMRGPYSDNITLSFCMDKDSQWWKAEDDTMTLQRADLNELVDVVAQLEGSNK